ncbi:MAG TPA: RNA-binding S4 domain-containing protein [Clostridia bacterium]|nr:RNA-binding S4 domain-containing protein [Clostridia bacterium]
MRLDKFLKTSRLVKRRTVAKEMCDAGRVSVNYRPAKAGAEVQVGDIITINRAGRVTEVEILEIRENVPAPQASDMYRLVEK